MDPELLAKQWQLVKDAPVVFGLAIAMLAIGMWWLLGLRWKGKIDGLTGQIGILNERLDWAQEALRTAHETTARAQAEASKYNTEVVELRRYISTVTAPPKIQEHSLSASTHSANLSRLLTDVSTATDPQSPKFSWFSEIWKK